MSSNEVPAAAARVRLLLMDVDGVLTDGRLIFTPLPDGNVVEAKVFDVSDGAGVGLARRAGLRLGILSGRSSPVVSHRAAELKIEFIYQGLGSEKLGAFQEIVETSGVPADAICFIGDDIQDIPVLRRVGFPVAVANACAEAKQASAYITARDGGRGAVRELVELILKAQGAWESVIAGFCDN